MLGDGTQWATVGTFLVAAGSPGPATLAVSAASMAHGIRNGLSMAAGLAVGLAFWGVLAGAGFSTVVAQSAALLMILKIIGGAYLLYLAFVTARSAMIADPQERQFDRGNAGFRQGMMLNLANPKAVLAWVAALALGGVQSAQAPVLAVLLCGLSGAAVYLAYALIFSRHRVMAFYARYRRHIETGFAVLFGLAGLRLFFWKNVTD